jgi:hypothetical protein
VLGIACLGCLTSLTSGPLLVLWLILGPSFDASHPVIRSDPGILGKSPIYFNHKEGLQLTKGLRERYRLTLFDSNWEIDEIHKLHDFHLGRLLLLLLLFFIALVLQKPTLWHCLLISLEFTVSWLIIIHYQTIPPRLPPHPNTRLRRQITAQPKDSLHFSSLSTSLSNSTFISST